MPSSSSSSFPFRGCRGYPSPEAKEKNPFFSPFFHHPPFLLCTRRSNMYIARDMYFSPSAKKGEAFKKILFFAPLLLHALREKRGGKDYPTCLKSSFLAFSLSLLFLGGSGRHQRGGDSPFSLGEAASLKNSPGQRTEGEKRE